MQLGDFPSSQIIFNRYVLKTLLVAADAEMNNPMSLLTRTFQSKMRQTIDKLITKYISYIVKYLSLELKGRRKAAGQLWGGEGVKFLGEMMNAMVASQDVG